GPGDGDRLADVVLDQAEMLVPYDMREVLLAPGEEAVDHDDVQAFAQQAIGEMAPEESSAAKDDRARHFARPYRSSSRTTSSSSGVEASRMSQSVAAIMRWRSSGPMRNDSPGSSTRSPSCSPSRPNWKRSWPARRWIVSSLRSWYWRLRACPARTCRILPT